MVTRPAHPEPVDAPTVKDGDLPPDFAGARIDHPNPFMPLSNLFKRYRAWLHRPAPEAGTKASRRRVWIGSVAGVVALLAVFFWFTSARILTDKVEISVAVTDPHFAESLGPLLGAEFSSGNRVELLVNGDEFFPAMLKAIREAEKTITLETYIWSSGEISEQFIEALSERAGRRQGARPRRRHGDASAEKGRPPADDRRGGGVPGLRPRAVV